MSSYAQSLVFQLMSRLRHGSLTVRNGGQSHTFGEANSDLHAVIDVRHPRFFTRLLHEGETGAGTSYQDGDWSSPDLVAVIRLACRNMGAIESTNLVWSALGRFVQKLRHKLRPNSIDGARQNIADHYDLSNDLFRLFLDERMMYSSAVYDHAGQSLEEAQFNKIDRICRKLQLKPGDHVLEIGTGWGGFALHAAREYGCRVTTTTISRQQHAYAQALLSEQLPDPSRVTLLLEDYRNLRGRFDRIVSIEMFEAVGLRYYDDFFSACDRLLAPHGAMLLQTIAMQEQRFDAYRANADWIQKVIFPGGELASVRHILASLGRATTLNLGHAEDIGLSYALTLEEWRRRFLAKLPEVFALGFDERFARTWEYYLAYCEGAFRERHVQTFQLLLTKHRNLDRLFHEPVDASGEQAHACPPRARARQ